MIEGTLLPLGRLLRSIGSAPWTHAIYIKGPRPWGPASECSVLDQDHTDSAEDDPPFSRESGLSYALSVQDARGVVENLTDQCAKVSDEELVRALDYYVEHDAFWIRDR